MNFTIVLGVDAKHLERIPVVYPNWYDHKREIRDAKVVIFYDETQLSRSDILNLGIIHNVDVVPWSRDEKLNVPGESRFFDPQRQKMLAGFIHIPPAHVKTDYWLKIDLDVVAKNDDSFINPYWFDCQPAIIGQPWGYTKPADQLDILDTWSESIPEFRTAKIEAKWEPGATMVVYPRISSWLAFVSTQFSEFAKKLAVRTGGPGYMPVPSQDGYHWYVAHRLGLPILRIGFKGRGWDVRRNFATVKKVVADAQKTQN